MNALSGDPQIAHQLFIALSVYALKASIMTALALVTVVLMSKSSALARSLVLKLAIGAVMVMPLAALIVPGWYVALPDSLASVWPGGYAGQVGSGLETAVDGETTGAWSGWPVCGLLVWLSGAAYLAVRMAAGRIVVLRLRRRALPFADTESRALAVAAAGIPSQVIVLIGPAVVPFVSGLTRPFIMLPENSRQWTTEKLRIVLQHEYAHIRQGDSVWMILAGLFRALHWFNPLAHITYGRLVSETEKSCDDAVLALGTSPDSYASYLIEFMRTIRVAGRAITAGVPMARTSYMEGRLMSILREQRRSTKLRNIAVTLTVLIFALLLLPLSGWQVLAGEKTEAPAKKPAAQPVNEKLPAPDEFVEVTTMPEMTSAITPVYPAEAKNQGIEGKVWVMILVDSTGAVRETRVKKSSGNNALDDAALAAAKTATFIPATADGKPVGVWVAFSIEFVLGDAEKK
ncbi:MAG: TonB family protein [candidate division Zixibacteria bacterium]|jgi:TonB family protein|nr:TonB family protein [candidate division Zixibacteria bacterium]